MVGMSCEDRDVKVFRRNEKELRRTGEEREMLGMIKNSKNELA